MNAEQLQRTIDDMTRAVARHAITLLHSVGLSAVEAEMMVMEPAKNIDFAPVPIAKYEGNVKLVRIIKDAAIRHETINVGADEYVGRVAFTDCVFQFDQLVPLGQRIEKIETDTINYYGVVAVQPIDDADCTYRCSVDHFTYKP